MPHRLRLSAARLPRLLLPVDGGLKSRVLPLGGNQAPPGGEPDRRLLDLGVDPSRLRHDRGPGHARAREGLPALSAAIAAYDCPDDGTVRPMAELRTEVGMAERWRLSSQYTHIARDLPGLLTELTRAFEGAAGAERIEWPVSW